MPSSTDWSQVSQVFDAVADLARADRPAALDRLCADADDPAALRAEVEALLAADAQADATDASFRLGDAASAAALVEPEPVAGERVGPWRVVRPIGRGGMGRVDLVERADGGYQQQAALKRMSLVAPGRVRRFLRERQILATLDHPGIARLLDGGVASDGAPYLVMEYVEGVPITEYARTHDLGLRERLALFVQVCDAVAYAHRHLVVHRDLKPSNVLVGSADAATEAGSPGAGTSAATLSTSGTQARDMSAVQVSLLDFGIARLLEDDADEFLTAEGPGAPLTPGYAAPEQIAGGAVTTATDVYSLGVLLYELLTGRRPHPTDTRQGWAEAVLHQTPPPPSQTVVAGGRSGIQRRLRGDLDAIALTALRREPEARYASALDFAADLRRYLAHEPVQARAPSAWYRARRFVGRHRTATIAAGLLLMSILGGAGATLWQAQEARLQAVRSQATADFLTGLFQAADPTAAASDTLTALDLLARGARRLDAELGEQPRVRADLYAVIGRSYLGLGQADSAIAFARRALALRTDGTAPDPEAAVAARILLGQALFVSDPIDGNREMAQAVAQARTVGDAALLDALEAQATLAGNEVLSPAETVAVFDEAVEIARRVEGEGSPRLGHLLTLLAFKVSSAHQHGRIEPLLLQAVANLPADRVPFERSTALVYLAELQGATGKPDVAWQTLNEAMALRRRVLPSGDVRIAEVLSVRARLAGDGAEQAERDAREAVEITAPIGGDAHITALGSLGASLLAQDRYDEALEVYSRRVRLAREVYGAESTGYPAASTNVARTLHRARRYAEAARAWTETIRLTGPAYGPESAQMVSTLLEASKTEEARGEIASAERLLTRAHAAGQSLPTSSGVRARSGLHLGRIRLDSGRPSDAIVPLQTAMEGREALARPGERSEGPDAERADALMGRALVATGQAAQGRRLLTSAVPVLEREFGRAHPETVAARATLDG